MTIEQQAGLSTARLRSFDRVIKEKYLDRGYLAGTVTQIWRRGEMAHASVLGSMDIARNIPMRDDAIFRIYSMTKAVTGVALLILVEDGKIGLLDEVATYVPAWKDLGVYRAGTLGSFQTNAPTRPMRVIDLAAHTAGLTYPWMRMTNVDAAYRELGLDDFSFRGGLEAMIETLSKLPLEYSPGDAWLYSISIDVVGYLIQKLSGLSFGEFLRQRLFDPLRMVDTGFFCPPEKLDRLTTCYESNPDGSLRVQDDAMSSRFAAPPALESGGGGLLSTARDYMRFARMLLNGGSLDDVQILSPKSVALFSHNLLPAGRDMHHMSPNLGVHAEGGPLGALYAGVGASLAGGVTIDLVAAGLPGTVGEFGWYGAAETAFFVDPKEDLAFVFMTQTRGMTLSGRLRRELRTLVYSSFLATQA